MWLSLLRAVGKPIVLTIQRKTRNAKNQFAILNNNVALAHCVNNSEKNTQGVKTPCYKNWIATPSARNDNENNFAIFNYALSGVLKNQFEIISQSDYGFCYKNYSFNLNQVFRNNYDFCDFDFGRNSNFGKNYFGNCNFGLDFGNEIYDGKNNLAGFLFNRKINSKKNFNQGEKR